MANLEHVAKLKEGTQAWNRWRQENADIRPDLHEANLSGADLIGARLHEADLSGADLSRTNLSEANLRQANLSWANLSGADLNGANLRVAALIGANLNRAHLSAAYLSGANLNEADLSLAQLAEANLNRADLSGAYLNWANLSQADLRGAQLFEADLSAADLSGANLSEAYLSNANLSRAILENAVLVRTELKNAVLSDCHVYGMSVWDVNLTGATQSNLVITPEDQPEVQVDSLRVAQFIYLLLHNENIRDVIDTVGNKGVLLLGRFTGGRMTILDRLREELRKRGFVPIVFNFDKPQTKDFTETVRLLAGLSHFVIADITNPRSAPLELQAVVPECMVPFVPILEGGEEPFAMFRDLWIKHRDWVLDLIRYSSLDRLVEVLDKEIIIPAKEKFAMLLARKAEELRIKDI